MKILLIGANGQLGTDLHTLLQRAGATLSPVTHAQLDICNFESVSALIGSVRPEVVINTAAFHKVEECETEPARAFQVNAIAARNLAQASEQNACVLMHFSTDYVFDGEGRTPYSESDLPGPLNVYGVSKLAGEHLIQSSTERCFIIRTCGLYGRAGSSGKGGNFVQTMLRLASKGGVVRVVDDQTLTPTYTLDLAETVTRLIGTQAYGLYHISSEGQCSWYEFAREIFSLRGIQTTLLPVKTEAFPSPVTRPAYSVLNKGHLNSLGLDAMPHWKDALGRYLEAIAGPA